MFSLTRQDSSPMSLVERAWKRLQHQSTFQGRTRCLRIDEENGRLILQGKLPSFYLKQQLQAALRDVEGVREIDNRVEVQWPERR